MDLKEILHALVEASAGEGSTIAKEARELIHTAIEKLDTAAAPVEPEQPKRAAK
jgi:hypothetical protein